MSSSPLSKRKTESAPPAARLIPGVASLRSGGPRKKPQSVTLDGRHWRAEEHENPVSQPDALRVLAQAVFPRPATPGQSSHLVTSVCSDFVCLAMTFVMVRHFRGLAAGWDSFAWAPASAAGFIFLQGAILTLLAYSEGLYRIELLWSAEEQRVLLGKVVGLSTLVIAPVVYVSKCIPLATLAVSAPLNYLLMLVCREWERRTAIRIRSRHPRNVLIVGTSGLARQLATHLNGDAKSGRQFRGFLVENGPLGGDVRGTVDDLARVARAEFVDEIILMETGNPVLARRVVREAQRNRLDVRVVPDLFGFRPRALEDLGDVPVLTLHEEAIPAGGLLVKRLLDVCMSGIGLMLSVPLLLATALIIKFDSPGPVLYGAPRIGRKGRRFRCFKFRTMVSEADRLKIDLKDDNQREGPFFKIVNDPRITRAGKFLRRYSLDELPQLWNVLQGDMSMVGPRPHPIDDCAQYDLDHLRRLDVTPGITGLWQVTARRDPSFERNMALDLEYIENWSLALDLRILLKTVSIVLQGTGA